MITRRHVMSLAIAAAVGSPESAGVVYIATPVPVESKLRRKTGTE